jgi:hypothetical protein
MDEVIEFITRRFKSNGDDNKWLNGNCYWFAQILLVRFPYLGLYYLPIKGHFVVGANEKYYDYDGLHTYEELGETPIDWNSILTEEPSWAKRILRDCRD